MASFATADTFVTLPCSNAPSGGPATSCSNSNGRSSSASWSTPSPPCPPDRHRAQPPIRSSPCPARTHPVVVPRPVARIPMAGAPPPPGAHLPLRALLSGKVSASGHSPSRHPSPRGFRPPAHTDPGRSQRKPCAALLHGIPRQTAAPCHRRILGNTHQVLSHHRKL